MSTHHEPPSCIGWVLVVRRDAAALGQAGLHILPYDFSEPQANWIVSAHPSLRLQLAGAGCGGIDPSDGIVLWRLSDFLLAKLSL